MSHRLAQINELVRQQLNELLLTNVDFPQGCLVTINAVETSKDLRHAKVFISVLPTKLTGKALDRINKNIGHLQFLLNKQLHLRPLPRLRFVIDNTESQASEIDRLINEAMETLKKDDSAS